MFNAAFVPIIYFFLVETKKRSLEELDVIFAAGGDPVKKEKAMPYGLSVAESRRILGLETSAEDELKGDSEEDFKSYAMEVSNV